MRADDRRNHQRVRVLTLNIWGLPWPLSRDLDARVDAIGTALGGMRLDMAAFQEVWTDDSREKLIALGAAAGLRHAWFPPGGAGGLLILARPVIRDARFSQYQLRGLPEKVQHSDYWGEKGFATVTLDSDEGEIAVVTTHLHASYRKRSEDEYIGHRTGQIVQLAAGLAQIESPMIVLGDFNIREPLEEYRVLQGLTDLQDLAVGFDQRQPTILATSPYRKKSAPAERIDYIFRRDGRRLSLFPRSIERVLDGEIRSDEPSIRFSDHAGLLAEFALVPGGTPPPRANPAALELARKILADGRLEAIGRRMTRIQIGGVGSGLAAATALAAFTPLSSRRRFLRACCIGAAGIAAMSSGTSFALAGMASPEELAAYDTVLGMLDQFASRSSSSG